jgi:2-polyprenyl-6-methoxyphenol hydroxylase-like FAD-dependent oxidoreductase
MVISHPSKLTFQIENWSYRNTSQAIVIGGSIAGLLAARVLSNYFERVLILERDRFSANPQPRQGIPQSYHPHVLLIQGQQILEQFFPGLTVQLAEQGALTVDWSADFRWHLGAGWAPRFPSDLMSTACTRNLLEATIRQRLVADPCVEILEAHQVQGLLADASYSQVTGVRVQNAQKQSIELRAQLVVDASGRGSKATKWLSQLGYDAPEEATVKSFLGYSTCWYESLSDEVLNCKMLYLMPKPPYQSRGAVMQKTEQGRWLVNLIGVGKDYPPTDHAGFLDFAQSMHDPIVYESIRDARPLSSIYGYQRTENRCRHYERLDRRPDNFIITGDAVCAFNPVYGQGMTTAARGAIALEQSLRQVQNPQLNLKGFAKRFQKKLAQVNTLPWMMATSDDFRWPDTEGKQPNLTTRLIQNYLVEVQREVPNNKFVFKKLAEVIHLINSPTSLLHPQIIGRILYQKLNLLNKVDFN